MSEHIESVNSVARIYRYSAESSEGPRQDAHMRWAERLEAVAEELARLYGLTRALPPDLGNIFDLPPELLKELSVTKADALEDQLVTVISAYGGTASLDQILVGLYRKFGVQQKRRFLQNKLYRMSMIWSVPSKKGIYTTEPPKEPSEDTHTASNDDVILTEPVDDIIEDIFGESSAQEEEDDGMPF